MNKYNIDDLIDTCINKNSTEARQNKIQNFKDTMISCIQSLQDTEKDNNKKESLRLLQTFAKILDTIGEEVFEMKEKYRQANFDERRQKKIIQIANDINLFRDQCHEYKDQTKKVRSKIHDLKNINRGLIAENSAVRSALARHKNSKQSLRNNGEQGKIYSITDRYQQQSQFLKQRLDQSERAASNKKKSNSMFLKKGKILGLQQDSPLKIKGLRKGHQQEPRTVKVTNKYNVTTISDKRQLKRSLMLSKQL